MFFLILITTIIFTANAQNIPDNERSADVNVVGGKAVNIEDYPYQVSIINDEGFWCSGSILTQHHVLSAAHCTFIQTSVLFVRAGSSLFDTGGSLHEIVQNVTFDDVPNHDISIFRVKQPIIFDQTRQPIKIAPKNLELKPGKVAVLSGWGDTTVERLSEQLRAVKLPIIDRKICSQFFKDTDVGELTESQICAGYLKGGKDGCHGDSGGPLVMNGQQIGIVSMGHGCARKNYPGVYTVVNYFYDWIMDNIKD